MALRSLPRIQPALSPPPPPLPVSMSAAPLQPGVYAHYATPSNPDPILPGRASLCGPLSLGLGLGLAAAVLLATGLPSAAPTRLWAPATPATGSRPVVLSAWVRGAPQLPRSSAAAPPLGPSVPRAPQTPGGPGPSEATRQWNPSAIGPRPWLAAAWGLAAVMVSAVSFALARSRAPAAPVVPPVSIAMATVTAARAPGRPPSPRLGLGRCVHCGVGSHAGLKAGRWHQWGRDPCGAPLLGPV